MKKEPLFFLHFVRKATLVNDTPERDLNFTGTAYRNIIHSIALCCKYAWKVKTKQFFKNNFGSRSHKEAHETQQCFDHF